MTFTVFTSCQLISYLYRVRMSYRIHINQFIREKITFMLFNSKNGNMKKNFLKCYLLITLKLNFVKQICIHWSNIC